MIGQTISHYKILEKLGEGGMGVVYKAEDTKLKRTVALKFLSSQAVGSKEEKTRFVHEAQAAAALNHNNICTIYEIDEREGQSFIAMECVEGESLKSKLESGPLKFDDAIGIIVQAAEGLEKAHDRGIVHRDIKAANIMVTSEGQAKIMDFGLAKAAGMTKVTRTGTTVGTLAYMSPEQARGGEVDHRTDIWSLGVVLYELLTGKIPFKGDHEAAMVYSIMNEDVAPPSDLSPDVPAELDSIVAKMLQKNPDDRYTSAGKVLSDLRHLQSGLAVKVALPMSRKAKRLTWGVSTALLVTAIVSSLIIFNRGPDEVVAKTLAVVDFDIISGEEADYLAAGLAEGISVKLSKLGSVRVVSSDDIRRLRKKDLSAKEVASQLGAQFALGGSLLKSGEQIRVTPQLIDASSGDVIWSELFDREFDDVFGFLDEISLNIVAALELELDSEQKVALEQDPTESPEAYDHYLRGRHFYYRLTFRDNELAVKEFQRALQIDPDYPLALAGLADAYVQRYKERYDYDEVWLDEAERLVRKALEYDPDLAEAYESQAEVLLEKDNLLGALDSAQRARTLRPDWDEPYVRLGYIYQRRGENRDALEMYERALAIRPSVDALCGKGNIFHARGEIDSAEAAYRAASELNPEHWRPHKELGEMFNYLAQHDQAEKMFRRTIEVRPDHYAGYNGLFWTLCQLDRKGEAEQLLRGFAERYPYNWQAYGLLFSFYAWDAIDELQAVRVLEEAIERNPDRAWPRLLMAMSHGGQMASESGPEKAAEAIQQAVALRPNSSTVLRWAGELYADMDSLDRAIDFYKRALEENPGSASILNSMAISLLEAGRHDSAATVAARAIEQAPGVAGSDPYPWSTGNYSILGNAMSHLERSDEFMDILQAAVERYDDDPKFHRVLANELRLTGRFEEAVAAMRRALAMKKDHHVMREYYVTLWHSEDLEAALSAAREAHEMSPAYYPHMRWVIMILKSLGRFEEIDRELARLRKAADRDFWGHFAEQYYASMRRFSDVIAAQETMLEGGGGSFAASGWKQSMAETYRRMGDFNSATRLREEILASKPPAYVQHWAHKERALLAAIHGELPHALRLAEKAYEMAAGHWYYSFSYADLIARLQYANGESKKALATASKTAAEGGRKEGMIEIVAAVYRQVQLADVTHVSSERSLERALIQIQRSTRSIRWSDPGLKYGFCALMAARVGDSALAGKELELSLKIEPERADIAYCAAAAYSLLGDADLALQWLETAVERGYQELWWARVDPDLDSLRELPRFQEIMNDWDRRMRVLID